VKKGRKASSKDKSLLPVLAENGREEKTQMKKKSQGFPRGGEIDRGGVDFDPLGIWLSPDK